MHNMNTVMFSLSAEHRMDERTDDLGRLQIVMDNVNVQSKFNPRATVLTCRSVFL